MGSWWRPGALLLLLGGCAALSGADALEVTPASGAPAVTGTDGGLPIPPNVGDGAVTEPTDAKSPTKVRDGGGNPDAGLPPPDPGDDDGGGVSLPPDAGIDAGVTTTVFPSRSLAEDERATFGPFVARAGTSFLATTAGNRDCDLYLNFGGPATFGNADCSSEEDDAEERCRRTVPSSGTSVYLMVNGWESCTFNLTVQYIAGP